MTRIAWALIFAALTALWVAAANAGEAIPGPIPAQVVRVIDGDTIVIRARIWLGLTVEETLRIDGMDTPERGAKAKCNDERRDAELATAALKAMIFGKDVSLTNIRRDKYGRLLARVETSDGADVAQAMIAAGHARGYTGGKRQGWCP